jgi:hypothetical protein
MGARTVFEVKDQSGSIFLYSHWGGSTKVESAVHALMKAEPRWSDTTYGMRIFISEIIRGDWSLETGYGISAKNVFEESYEPMVFDFETRVVTFGEIDYSFEDFIHNYWE